MRNELAELQSQLAARKRNLDTALQNKQRAEKALWGADEALRIAK